MLKVKLTRIGKRGQPQYRIVVVEAKSPRDTKFTDHIGHYDPLQNPAKFDIDLDKYNAWLKKGAQPTETIRKMVKNISAKPTTKKPVESKPKAEKKPTKPTKKSGKTTKSK